MNNDLAIRYFDYDDCEPMFDYNAVDDIDICTTVYFNCTLKIDIGSLHSGDKVSSITIDFNNLLMYVVRVPEADNLVFSLDITFSEL